MILPQPRDFAEAGRDIDSALGLDEAKQALQDSRDRRDRIAKRFPADRAPSPELRAAQVAVDVRRAQVEALTDLSRELIHQQAARLAQQRAEEMEEAA